MGLPFVKAHAYGNDFLFVEEAHTAGSRALAVAMCDRHSGIGADGLITYRPRQGGAAMTLFNADGSVAEVSGNGVRCLAALVGDGRVGSEVVVETQGGVKSLTLLASDGSRHTFRAHMGHPADLRRRTLDVDGEAVEVTTLSVGNPQCIVVEDRLDDRRFHRLAPRLAAHAAFPAGTNVEFVEVLRSDAIRILIWERGVGPTAASGTGACGAAVAAAAQDRVARVVDVSSPGGTQRVEWHDDGVYVTGWAEIIARGTWLL